MARFCLNKIRTAGSGRSVLQLISAIVIWQSFSSPVGADTLLTLQVSASINDVTEVNGTLDTTSSTLWLGTGGSATTSYTGLRFTGVAIPPGSVINSAYLQVYSTQSQWIGYRFSIAADASGNSPVFGSTSRPSQRVETSNTVNHNDDVSWAANTWYSLDEMKTVIQEVVNRPDWQAGNSLSIIIHGTSGTWARKFVTSFDGAAANAARLVVSFANNAAALPTAILSVSPSAMTAGQSATLSWSTTNAAAVSIDQGIGTVSTSGSLPVNPVVTTTYTITATNSNGSATATTTLTVSPPPPPPTATLSAAPGSINLGGSATLSWTTANATTVTIDHGVGSVGATGSAVVSPAATTTYTLTATNFTGSVSAQATVTVIVPPPTVVFGVAPGTIISGSSSTLSWSTTNASTVTIDQGIGSVASSGSRPVNPTATTTYTLTAGNSAGSTIATTTLTVTPPLPTATLSVSPTSLTTGQSATLTWTTSGAVSLSIDQGIGTVAASGSQIVSPAGTTTYTLTATNVSGSTIKTATLAVNPPGGTITTQVNSSGDDVNEVNGILTTNASALWLGNAGSTTTSYTGLRFANLAIPVGSTIGSASLQVYSSASQWITYSFSIAADASGNSAAFSPNSRPSQRTPTVSNVNHSDNVSWAANTWYSLDEMKSVIQEVVSRGDWQAGNSLSIIIHGTGTGSFARKFISSFDSSASTAPKLVVSYTAPVAPPVPTATLTVAPATVTSGSSAVLSWTTTNAAGITIDQGIGSVAPSGSTTVTPAATTTYTLIATNSTGSATTTTTLAVNPPPPPLPTASISASPSAIVTGNSSTLSWSTTNATSVSIDQGIGGVVASGSIAVSPTATTTYTITATGSSGVATQSTTLTVNPAPPGTIYFPIGAGFTDVIPHQIVRTNTDQLYVFASSQPYTSVVAAYWTANPGLPSSTADFGGSAQVTLAANPLSVSPAYDGANTVHILANLQNGSLVDVPFDLGSNTFRPAWTLATNSATLSGAYFGSSGITSMVDPAGTLHVVYWAAGNQIVHMSYTYNPATNTLSQASAPFALDTTGAANHPSIAVSPLDNSVTVAWVSEAATPKRILARVRDASGIWGATQGVSNPSVFVWTSTSGGLSIDQGPSLLVTADGAKHLTYIENYDATGSYGHVHYVKDAGSGWVDQALTEYSHDPALAVTSAGNLYIIGHGHPNDVAVACQSLADMCFTSQNADGSWGQTTLFAPHTSGNSFDSSPSVKWSVVGWNRPESIEFLFFQTPYTAPILFYGRLQ
jgi:hypothetical protein